MMSKTMQKKVFGILGVSGRLANLNADFSGYARTTPEGVVFGSDMSMKYPVRSQWEINGYKVLNFKRPIINKDGNISCRTLKENYEFLTGVSDLSKEDPEDTIKNLFEMTDVRQFGATFAESSKNIGIQGAVQFSMGYNKYEECTDMVLDIIGPHNSGVKETSEDGQSAKEKKNSSVGKKIVVDEAHYFFPFTINPNNYKTYIEANFIEYGYTEEDYALFKESALVGVTGMNTASKAGCENEFAMFLETPVDTILPIDSMNQGIKFYKEGDKGVIEIPDELELEDLYNDKVISKIEIYYNPITTKVKANLTGATYYNIFTKKEIKR